MSYALHRPHVGLLLISWLSLLAQAVLSAPAWLRDPELSPDGSSLAFRADGDLFVVPLNAEVARLLRGTHWTVHGRVLLLTSDRDGLRTLKTSDSAVDAYALSLDPAIQRLEVAGERRVQPPATSEDLAPRLQTLRAEPICSDREACVSPERRLLCVPRCTQ